MKQECTWRIVNYSTKEIVESDILCSILGFVETDIRLGEKIDNMRFYHIESPGLALDLEKYLDGRKRAIERIRKASKRKDIGEIKYWVRRYKEQYGKGKVSTNE